MQSHDDDTRHDSWLVEPKSEPAAPAPSKSWLLALDDQRAGHAGWKPVVPAAPEPRCVRLPSASNAEYVRQEGALSALKRPLLWSFVAVIATGILAAALQLVRAHSTPARAPAPMQTPEPTIAPAPADEELETGALLGPECPSAHERVPAREHARSELVAAHRAHARESDALTYVFPRVTESSVRASSAAQAPRASAIEAAAPRVRIVGREHIAGVWQGATIPMEALEGKSKWLTPSIGRVRVELLDGSTSEGRLQALGQGRIWIESDGGRVSFPGSEVRNLRQLTEALASTPESAAPALPDVVVRTRGGVFRGKLLRQEEGRITLLLPAGGRITLEEGELESSPDAASARIHAP